MTSEQKAIKEYRAEIRRAWLGVAVSRNKFTSHETRLVNRWFSEGVPVGFIVEAIKRTRKTAEERSLPIYSIGLISAHLRAVQKERARMNVGGRPGENGAPPSQATDEWRAEWADALEEIAELERNPEKATMYRELLSHLPTLTKEQARAQYREIQVG